MSYVIIVQLAISPKRTEDSFCFVIFPDISYVIMCLRDKAGVKLYNIVGATLLLYLRTFSFLLNKAEINNVLHQQCRTDFPQKGFYYTPRTGYLKQLYFA